MPVEGEVDHEGASSTPLDADGRVPAEASKGEDDQEHQQAEPRTHLVPPTVSLEERENHLLTGHAQYRSWCPHCVRTRGRCDRHPSANPENHVFPELAFDYGYLASRSQEEDAECEAAGHNPMLNMRDGQGKGVFPYMLEAKGTDHEDIDAEIAKVSGDIAAGL